MGIKHNSPNRIGGPEVDIEYMADWHNKFLLWISGWEEVALSKEVARDLLDTLKEFGKKGLL